MQGGAGNDALEGDAGNDTLDGASGADGFSGGEGSDLVDYAARTVAVTATIGAGANDGASGESDDIFADVENVRGGSAGDSLSGNAAANTLTGMGGADTLAGGGGADTLLGGDANDTLQGGDANDTLQGGSGADILQGGAGSDIADYPRTAPVSVSIGDGANDGESGEHDDVQGDVERLRGGSANDTLTGDSGANLLYGGAGDDTITGGAGNDILYGQAGADTLNALDGAPFLDKLYCGSETDTTSSDAADTRDIDCETNIGF